MNTVDLRLLAENVEDAQLHRGDHRDLGMPPDTMKSVRRLAVVRIAPAPRVRIERTILVRFTERVRCRA